MAVRTPPAEALMAIGGTLEWDPYRLPTSMIELVPREQGWQATSLGTRLPAATIAEALRDNRSRLFWLSVSSIESVPAFLEEYAHLHRVATETGAAVVVGGRALTAEIRQQMAYSAYCDTLLHLVTIASSLTSSEFARHKQEKSDGPNAPLGAHER